MILYDDLMGMIMIVMLRPDTTIIIICICFFIFPCMCVFVCHLKCAMLIIVMIFARFDFTCISS